VFRGLDQQQTAIKSDATQLRRLQSAAQGADGQMAALGYANQLASHQTNQLMQIRALLIAQQNAATTKAQVEHDRQSQADAAAASLRNGSYRASPVRSY
jgi:P-type conjugative transfer protein TrbJ